jgi:hypothetical protein
MYDILKLLFEICLFKKGPQDLPYSVWLLRLLIFIYAVVRFLMLAIHTVWLNAFLQIIVEIVLTIGFSWVILYVHRTLNRFYQVSSAFLGTDTLINFLALPGILTMEIGRGGWIVFVIMLGLIAWQCAVIAHIIHNALDQKLMFSFGLAILYLLASYQVINLLFPEIAVVE